MSRKRSLGRGLDALLPKSPAPAPAAAPKNTLSLDKLKPSRRQPRTKFEDQALAELAESIRAKGLIQPLIVTPNSDGTYAIVAGERRWRAARLAELEEVPVVIRQVEGDQDLLELALVENIQRADLDPVEEAVAYRALSDEFGLSQAQIAEKVGRSRPAVANALRLLNLPEAVLDLLREGSLSAGQARPLLALDSSEEQVRLAQEAVRKSLTARDLESLASAKDKPAKVKKITPPEPHAAAAAETLTQRLQTQVDILRKGRGGQVRIHFHSEEELMRIYDLMVNL